MSVERSSPNFVSTGIFALRLIWRADPRRFAAVLAVQLVTAIGLAVSLLLLRHVLGVGLAAGTDVGAAGWFCPVYWWCSPCRRPAACCAASVRAGSGCWQ
ncbi:hypothetical protein GCM10029976_008950 [Kribbella albertanoniae]